MQGRLLPKIDNLYQCHPLEWADEFDICKKQKINLIEWIIDSRTLKKNTLLNNYGREQIIKKMNESNVEVKSICADVLLEKNINSLRKYRGFAQHY